MFSFFSGVSPQILSLILKTVFVMLIDAVHSQRPTNPVKVSGLFLVGVIHDVLVFSDYCSSDTFSEFRHNASIFVVGDSSPSRTILIFSNVLISIGPCVSTVAIWLIVLVLTDVLTSIDESKCAVAVFLVVLPLTNVFVSTSKCESAKTIMENA